MMSLCKLLTILVLLGANDLTISAVTPPTVTPEHSSQCMEELGLNYGYGYLSPEIAYNQSCYTKCAYEKEGIIDSNQTFVLSKFPPSYSSIINCSKLVNVTDVCKKVTLQTYFCITIKMDPSWTKYQTCEKNMTYTDVVDLQAYCYERCKMIIDGKLDGDGNINIANLKTAVQYRYQPNNNITVEEAVDKCNKTITDTKDCMRDVNMYNYAVYVLFLPSSIAVENELQCAKENHVYPISVAQNITARNCYDRCLLIKSGDLDAQVLKTSNFLKKLNISQTKLDEYFTTCNMTLRETDKCSTDMYFYYCVSYLYSADPFSVKMLKECALETNSSLIPYRGQSKEMSCENWRCLLIKDGSLYYNASINATNLRQICDNDTIIKQSVDECKRPIAKTTCADEVNAYYCVTRKIPEKIGSLCQIETKYNATTGQGNYYCYSRCLMVHGAKLTPKGEVIVDSFKQINRNVTIIQNAITTCKTQITDADECTRVVSIYNCVGSEIMK